MFMWSNPWEECDGVLFVERAGELPSFVRLSHIRWSHSESESERAILSSESVWEGVDPKLCELLMTRVKPA
jgi:hypothetical protein